MSDAGTRAAPDVTVSPDPASLPRRWPSWVRPAVVGAIVVVLLAVGGWAAYRAIGGPDLAGGDGVDGNSTACLPFAGPVQVLDGARLANRTGHTVELTGVQPRSPRGMRVREVRIVPGPRATDVRIGLPFDPDDPAWAGSVVLGDAGYELAPGATAMAVFVADVDPGGAAIRGSRVSYDVGPLPYTGSYPLTTVVLPDGVRECPDDDTAPEAPDATAG